MENGVEYYPLTYPQKEVWLTDKLNSGTSIGNIAATLRFKGNVDYSLLERAINLFIEKNDAARLRIIEENGQPKQYISEYTYHKINLYNFEKKELTDLYNWEDEQAKKPFNLTDSELIHFELIKVSENDGGFFVKMHHLISDAWTMTLLGNQVVEYYIALKNGDTIPDGNNPSYIDFIKSEEEYLKSGRFGKDKEYWDKKFEVYPEKAILKKFDQNEISTRARRKAMVTPKKLSAKIRQYCAENKTSVYSLLIAALAMYINRVTSKENIVFGTTTLNRTNTKEKEMVGLFINIAPICLNISADMNFKTLVEIVSRDGLSLLRHQKYPYDLVLKEVRSKHKIKGNIFDIVLTYQNSKFAKEKHTEEYTTRWHFNGYQTESLNISVNDRESEGDLILDYSYLTDLFLAKEIEFINQHIINLLWHALDNPEKSISRLNMLSEKEAHKILYQFGNENGKKKYILDKNLNLVPIGIPGELYIAAEKVSKALIQNPFNPKEKLYKTGKLARWYPEGEIVYLGKTEEFKPKETQVIVAATFTSEPIGDYIKWWGRNFGYNFKMRFAPYNQVFQELLDSNSILAKNQAGINVILVRFEDYIRSDNGTDEAKLLKLEQIFKDLKEAIENFENSADLILAIFPVSTHLNLSIIIQNKINELSARLEETVLKHRNIYTVNLNRAKELYCVDEIFDIIKDNEGHMPFTDEYYAVIGTEIARKICAIKTQPFKVIVLDCDNTLWRGICGEQGALGVKIDGPYRKLQEFMLQKYNEGMLLAVCTKNNEKDVFEVFENNPKMVLNRSHIVNWKINWNEKSENIRNIAGELNLGLDSFIFIDDNPLECSKMVENCPEVLTLQLPPVEENIPVLLGHVWAFDRAKVTKEDTLRSEMYKAESKRKAIKESGLTIDEFIKSLGLKVSMRLIDESEIERAAQMTQRTNQFNLNTKRRTEKEISDLVKDHQTRVFVIEASDRFGDYGLVGLVILKDENDKLSVDTFLLSCRILGRKVEDVILAGIGKFALEQGKSKIEAVFVPSEKNKPILEFMERAKWDISERDDAHTLYSIQTGELASVIESIDFYFNKRYEHGDAKNNANENTHIKQFEILNKKAIRNEYNLCDTEILEGTIHKEHLLPLENFTGRRLLELPIKENRRPRKSKYKAPTNEIEAKLVKIWKQILKINKIGIDDDFFELGGDSLCAIQLQVNLLTYNWKFTTQDIYKYRTVRQMSNILLERENEIVKEVRNNFDEDRVVKNTGAKVIKISKNNTKFSNVLLIGATGYLGSHILADLLTDTKANIYCLIRAKTNSDAKEKLKENLRYYFGNEYISLVDRRLFIVRGDITLEHFGLRQNEYDHLQEKIDSVIHTAALVNYYGDYSNFQEINIKGTERVVKFCFEDNKRLMYISTMGISGQYLVKNKNENKVNLFKEDDLYIGQNYFDNPYVRSKYEAEILVNNYIKKGAKIAILRVGNLTGRFIDGYFQKNITQNAFYNIMKSIISIGAVSKNILNEAFDFTPVDYCSKAIVKIFLKNESTGKIFHIYNPNRISVLQIIKLFETIGIKIRCLDKDKFKKLINRILSDKSNNDDLKGIINDFDEENQLSFKTTVKLDCEATVSYLKQLGFEWPIINAEYINKIINHMKRVKYIS